MAEAVTRRCGCRAGGKQLGASCPKLSNPRHGTWGFRVRVPGPDGRPVQVRRSGYGTRKEAVAARAEIVGKVARNDYRAPSRVTVDTFLDRWLATKADKRPATVRSYTDALRPVRQLHGQRRLVDLTTEHVEQVKRAMLDGSLRKVGGKGRPLSARSVNLTLQALTTALTYAVDSGELGRNVARPVRPADRPDEAAGRAWTREQVSAFKAAAARDRDHAGWLLSLYGLRRSEVLGLRWQPSDQWSWVDLDAGLLHVGGPLAARTVVAGQEVLGRPKTRRGTRTLPLDDDLRDALKALKARQAAERLAAGEAYDGRAGFVIVDQLGRPVRPEHYSDRFAAVAQTAGCSPIRLHDLRHTSVTLMRDAGIPDHQVAAWHGHDEQVMRGIYTHVTELANAADGRHAAGL